MLAQQSVFEHQLRLVACQVQNCIEDKRIVVGLCPAAKTVFDSLAKRICTLSKEVHSLAFWLGLGGYGFTAERGD